MTRIKREQLQVIERDERKSTLLTLDSELVVEQRISGKTGLWSAALTWANRVTLLLRERQRGTIEAEGELVEMVHGKKSRRIATGKHLRSDAVEWARNEMNSYYLNLRENGAPVDGALPASGSLNWRELAYHAKRLPSVHARGKKNQRLSASQIQKNLRILDTTLVVFPGDLQVDATSPSHLALYHEVRGGEHLDWVRDEDGEKVLDFNGCRVLRRREHENPRKRTPYTPYSVIFPASFGRRNLPPAEEVTVTGELKDLQTMVRRLMKEKDNHGRPYLAVNPFAGLDLGNFEKRKLEPATTQRYVATMRFANKAVAVMQAKYPHHVYVPGMFRLILAILFHTSHRVSATCALKVSDVLLDKAAVQTAIGRMRPRKGEDKPLREWADVWIHGAIYWRRENDKEGYDRVIPINRVLRAEFDRYLAARGAAGFGGDILFPRPLDPTRTILDTDARDMLYYAEEMARQEIDRAGGTPNEVLPELYSRAFHAYRALWEVMRDKLGWYANRNSSYCGGWTTKGAGSQQNNYNHLSPVFIQGVVDGRSLAEVIQDDVETAEVKDVVNLDIGDADSVEGVAAGL